MPRQTDGSCALNIEPIKSWLRNENGQAVLAFALVKETYEYIEEVPKKLPTMALDMAVATSPTLSTARTAYDVLPKQEGSALAGIFNDPKQLAKHKEEAITFEKFLEYSKGKSLEAIKTDFIPEDGVRRPANSQAPGPEYQYRFVIDPADPNKIIDMRHFFVVGSVPFGVGNVYGLGVEIQQARHNITDSAFDHQDFFSNALGTQFFKTFSKQEDMTSQLEKFFQSRTQKQ